MSNEPEFFIRADFGCARADKKHIYKYWDSSVGLHSGKSKKAGYVVFPSVKMANKTVRRLRKLYSLWIKFEVRPSDEIPFIKKQIVERKKKEALAILRMTRDEKIKYITARHLKSLRHMKK